MQIMAQIGKQQKKITAIEPCRKQKLSCSMSDEEARLVDEYLQKHRITNRSRWLRETIIAFIYESLDEGYPTLFPEHEMRR